MSSAFKYQMTMESIGYKNTDNNYKYPDTEGFYRFWFFSHGKFNNKYD